VVIRQAVLLAAASVTLGGQVPDPVQDPLEKAYAALRVRQYDAAIELFRTAINEAPGRATIRKDLAYTYLKAGETAAARDQFAEAMRLAPEDFQAALEYAFLCHETGKTDQAHRVFDEVRKRGDPASRATAEQAFQNIDQPLAEGIKRWSEALTTNPEDFNAHWELATLAERRENLPLAAEHYLQAWRLRPDQRSLLVDYGRVSQAMGLAEQANSALLAASRGAEPRTAEAARELLPARYPYVYEFRLAIDLDPGNLGLRRELGFLLAAMGRAAEAEKEFAAIPQDLKQRPDFSEHRKSGEAKALAEKSYRDGYLKDALKYYSIAHEEDPLDFRVILQLGWTHNMLGENGQAVGWFDLARKSSDPATAAEAAKAYRNLRPSTARFRTTVWLFPIYSSRWRTAFTYGQVKVELKPGRLPLRAYLSTRLIGDTRGLGSNVRPPFLSESSLIFGLGLATDYWRGMMLWAEAGTATSYLASGRNQPRMAPDYRGGIAFTKGYGQLLGSRTPGVFFETNDDGVFVSRFQNDFVLYSQNRFGYTFRAARALGGLQTQWYWNTNAGTDLRRQYWANTIEAGPGLRVRWKWLPPESVFSISLVRGGYSIMEGNPYGRKYSDLRVGFWYAGIR
jgi:Tfp pilus assembly protein PilF